MTTGIVSMPNYDYTTFFANAHCFLENKFLDIGLYPNALDLYKDDLVEQHRHLKFKVTDFYLWKGYPQSHLFCIAMLATGEVHKSSKKRFINFFGIDGS